MGAPRKFMLLQIRNPEDRMRQQEVRSFSRALHCNLAQIVTFDLLTNSLDRQELSACDMVVIGGSGDYSAAGEGAWLERALDSLRELHELQKPTFASCWGFQALARALGGRVIHDPAAAELGTIELRLTDAGHADPIFGPLGTVFQAQAGHEDRVVELPATAVLLASSDKVAQQAYRIEGKPIYATQFHPELNRDDLLGRLGAYPTYVQKIAGKTVAEFSQHCRDTPETEALLRRFVQHVFA
ncbi:MAG: type 1 glutamine amidotransferase [Planctomycetales bacterium]|nr:type 1 glutamine amidotransferase [Planctomycetales bacterium]